MTWSYSGDPTVSKLDAVRFEFGDTDSDDKLLQDEEINYTLSIESDICGAAARCCEVLARKFARQADFSLGPQRVSASQRSEAFTRLGRELRSRVASSNPPYLGGADKNDELADARNSNLKPPIFKRDLMSNPGTAASSIKEGR